MVERESGQDVEGTDPGGPEPVDDALRRMIEDVVGSEMERLRADLPSIIRMALEKTRTPDQVGANDLAATVAGMVDAPLRRTVPVDEMLASALARGDEFLRRLEQDPDMLDAAAFGKLLGVTPQAVHLKRKRGEVLGLARATRKVWFPAWQVTAEGRLLPGLAELHAVFGGDDWRVHRFLRQRHGALQGATGLEGLKAGRLADVLTAAEAACDGSFD